MNDIIINVEKSILQHGKNSDRVYLMKLNTEKILETILKINHLVKNYQYTKIFAKIPLSEKEYFENNGYIQEASIPNFYKGKEDVLFLAKYFSCDRANNTNKEEIKNILSLSLEKSSSVKPIELQEEFIFKKASSEDAYEMANVYKNVFESYPFPIYNPEYLEETMKENIDYYGIWKDGKLIALSSSEKDTANQNTEMTDFATLPEHRGNNFAAFLLNKMEEDAKKRGLKIAYTIARAVSYGMNICFAKSGYTFAGTLINNTGICGQLESMNVWYKNL